MTVRAMNHTWIFCTKGIPENFFDIPNDKGVTLRAILEDQRIIQLWFDVRGDCAAMHGLYNVRLGNVIDVQPMELATRYGCDRKCIVGLYTALSGSGGQFMSQFELMKWLIGKREGGDYLRDAYFEPLNEHPLSPKVKRYVVGDTPVLFGLYHVYLARYPIIQSALRDDGTEVDLATLVNTESMLRVRQSETPGYKSGDRHEMQASPRVFREFAMVWSDGMVMTQKRYNELSRQRLRAEHSEEENSQTNELLELGEGTHHHGQMPGPSLGQHPDEPALDDYTHLNEENILQETERDDGTKYLLNADQGSLLSQRTELGNESEEDAEQLEEELTHRSEGVGRNDNHHGDDQSSQYSQQGQHGQPEFLPEDNACQIDEAVSQGDKGLERNEGLYNEPIPEQLSDRRQQDFKPEIIDEPIEEAKTRSYQWLDRTQSRRREQAHLGPHSEQRQQEHTQEEPVERMLEEDLRNSLWLESLGMIPQTNAWLQRLEGFNTDPRASERLSEQPQLETPPVELAEQTNAEISQTNQLYENLQKRYESPQASASVVENNSPAEQDHVNTRRPRGLRRLVNRLSAFDLQADSQQPSNQPSRRRSFMRLKALVDPEQSRLVKRASSFFRPRQVPRDVPREVPPNIFDPRPDGHLPRSSSYSNNPAWKTVWEVEQAKLKDGHAENSRTGSVRKRVQTFYKSGRKTVSEIFKQF
jgi:hypothetical protein